MRAATISMLAGLTLIALTVMAAVADVGPSEANSVENRFTQHDRNGDGRITRDEADGISAGLHTHFGKLDTNDDSALSLSEFRGHGETAPAQE